MMSEDISIKTGSSRKRNAISFISKGIYESSDIPMIQAQEVAQNSFDAIRTALKQGLIERGRIDISVKYDSITWTDNGSGMSEVELTNGFGNYGKSNKIGDLDSAGQYGIGVKSVINSSVMQIETVQEGTEIKAWVSRDVLHVDSIREKTGRPAGTSVTFILGVRKLNEDFVPPLFLYPRMKSDLLPVKFAERAVQLAFYLPFFDSRIDVYMNGQKISPSQEFIDSFYYPVDFMGGKLFISPFSKLLDTVLNVKGISYNVIGPGIRGSKKHCVARRNLANIEGRATQSVYVTSLVDISASRSEVSNFPTLEKLLIGYNDDEESTPVSDSEFESDILRTYDNTAPNGISKVPNVLDLISQFQDVVSSVLGERVKVGDDTVLKIVGAIHDRSLQSVVNVLASMKTMGKTGNSSAAKLYKMVQMLADSLTRNGFPIDYDGASRLLVAYAIVNGYFTECYLDEDGFLTLNKDHFRSESRLEIHGNGVVLAYPIPAWFRDMPYNYLKDDSLQSEYFHDSAGKRLFVPYLELYSFDELIGIYDRIYARAESVETLDVSPPRVAPASLSGDESPESGISFVTMAAVDIGVRTKKSKAKRFAPKSRNMSLMEFE